MEIGGGQVPPVEVIVSQRVQFLHTANGLVRFVLPYCETLIFAFG